MAKILVIDGEQSRRELLEWMLKGGGHEAIPVANGAEALATLTTNETRVVVVNIGLADWDRLIVEVRRSKPGTAVIGISAVPVTAGTLLMAKSLDLAGVLVEPFSGEGLLRLVAKAIGE